MYGGDGRKCWWSSNDYKFSISSWSHCDIRSWSHCDIHRAISGSIPKWHSSFPVFGQQIKLETLCETKSWRNDTQNEINVRAIRRLVFGKNSQLELLQKIDLQFASIWKYGSALWGCTKPSNTNIIQTRNKPKQRFTTTTISKREKQRNAFEFGVWWVYLKFHILKYTKEAKNVFCHNVEGLLNQKTFQPELITSQNIHAHPLSTSINIFHSIFFHPIHFSNKLINKSFTTSQVLSIPGVYLYILEEMFISNRIKRSLVLILQVRLFLHHQTIFFLLFFQLFTLWMFMKIN